MSERSDQNTPSTQLPLAGLELPQYRPSRTPEVRSGHLQAAMRLSRAMRRLPQHSRAETEAGIAICRHLQALLAESPPH